MTQTELNQHLRQYHSIYLPFTHLTNEQINTLSLGSYLADCINEVYSDDYSGAVIPATRTLEQVIKAKLRPGTRRARTIGALVTLCENQPDVCDDIFTRVTWPYELMSVHDFLHGLREIVRLRAQAAHAYISRRDVSRCLALCAMVINILNVVNSEKSHQK
ncbi:MAG: hypothetical protein AAGF95_31230 [Chloroflexota bacterium]